MPSKSQITVPLKKLRKLTTEQKHYYMKLDEGMLGEFNEKDWLQYFNDMFFQANNFFPRYPEDVKSRSMRIAIMKRVMNNFTPKETKGLIDFLFLADHDIKPKSQISIFLLSGGFLDTVSMGAQAWELGKYQNKSEMYRSQRSTTTNRNREWDSDKHIDKPKEEFVL